jgi:hypothetical protein|tara:strand:- start:561 stop:971 length:411 start_codon:yes stop_codon:yes gene_type:complete
MRLGMKIIKYFLISFFVLSIVDGQEIQKGGETPTSFTYDEALDMLKARDKQWEEKIAKANTLIEFQKITISRSDSLVVELEEQANIDSLTLVAKDKQIELLKARDVANEKMVKLIEKKWYENEYIWLGIGFILGKL